MSNVFKYIIFVFYLGNAWLCGAQNEFSQWYYGYGAGLNFLNNPPTAITNGVANWQEATASISNSAGNLLFYTNADEVKNANHVTMANGLNIGGSASASQVSIVKKPGSANLYYIFTVGAISATSALAYSIVDMNLAAGMGSVTVKNNTVFVGTTERVTACWHSNGIDVWIITHDVGSANFRAYLLTSNGLNINPVLSNTGGTQLAAPGGMVGGMKASPAGDKFAMVTGAVGLELFSFNATTGELSNPLTLISGVPSLYGVEFSPDGSKLYATRRPFRTIYQWNLCAGSNTAIVASQSIVYSPGGAGPEFGALQLAQNGKIYAAKFADQFLGVINSPNLSGALCNYVQVGVQTPTMIGFGLPDFVRGIPKNLTTFSVSQLSCLSSSFTAPQITPVNTVMNCAPVTLFSVSAYSWNFGNPGSGATNTSTLANPVHLFTGLGTYSVQLVISYSNSSNDTLKQVLQFLQPCISAISNSASCGAASSASIQSSAGVGPVSYTWTPSQQTGSVANVFPGTYTINAFDTGLNMTYSTTLTFTPTVQFTSTLTNTGMLNCNSINNGTASLNASGGSGNSNYLWTNGLAQQTTALVSGLGAGNHIVTVTDALSGCSNTHTFHITQPPALTLNVSSNSPTVCAGYNVALAGTVSGGTPGYTYLWTNGPSSASFTVSQAIGGNYIYTLNSVDANTCSISQTISIGFVNNPTLSVSSSSICSGNIGTFVASGATTYTWYPGNINASTYTASPPTGSSVYSVLGTAQSCTAEASATLVVKPVPSLSFNSYSITCASLGLATVVPSGGIGPFTFSWSPTAQTGSVVSGLNPGTYTLTTYDTGTGCTSTATTIFNSLIPLTGNLAFGPYLSCNGANTGTATFVNLSGGSGNEVYSWNNGISTLTLSSAFISSLSAGQWSVTVTDALTACQINSVFTIAQPPPLTLTIVSSSPTTCVGTSITFTASNAGGTPGAGPGYTYTWVAGPATDTHTVSEIIAGTSIYTVNSQDGNNCLSSQTIAVDFVPNPTLSVSNVSICPLEIGTLTVSGASSYTWSVGSTQLAVGSSFTESPFSSTQYTVIGSAFSCTSSALASILVKPIPNPFISHNSPLCENQNLLFSVSNGTAAVWSGPSAFASASINNTLTTANPNQSGIYAATITAINSCTASSSVSLTIKPLPSFSISPSSSSICANTTSVTLSISSSTLTSASNCSWSPNTGLSASNGTLVNAFPPATTVYTVTGTLNGCTATAETTVHVVPPPNLTGQLSSPTLCSQAFNGSPNTITLSAGGASMYTLVTIPDMLNSNPGGPVAALTSIPPYSGPGTATLSGSNGVCTLTTSLTFTVLPNPTVTINNYTPVICAGETFTYTNQGATTYTWSSSTPGSTLYSNGGVAVVSPSINSVFSVFGGSVGCNSALQTTSITVNPLPIVNISPNPLRLCLGDTAGLFAQGNGTSFTWYPPYGLTSYTTQQVGTYINQNQQYTVVATLNNCSNTAIGHVTVLPLPLATLYPLKDAVCLNDYIHLKGGGGMVYVWRTPLNKVVHGPELYLKASGMALAGTYTLQVSDANACVGYSTHPVAVHNLPQGYLIPEQVEFCVPYCNSFTFVPSAQSLITQAGPWSMNNFIYSGPSFTTCFSKTGEYNISGAIQDAFNCRNVVSLSVIGRPKPTAAFYITPENPVEGLDEVSFVNVTSNIIGYSWQSAGSYSTPLGMTNLNWMSFKSEEEYPAYVFEEAGVYGLMLMVKNEFNCWDTVMHTIKVESDFAAYIPNAFTPNGDGLNDTFYPVLRGVKKFDLQIFDRWGELIFKSTELGTLWDGTFKGQECKQDIYTYKLVLLTTKREEKIYSGQLSLIR